MSNRKMARAYEIVRRGYEVFVLGVCGWLKECWYHHRIRICVGVVLFVLELYAFLGTGIMLEDQVNYLTGEGSWGEQPTAESPEFCQKFVPQHRHLHMISFLMYSNEKEAEGTVDVRISDGQGQVAYEKTLAFSELSDGSFTNVKVNLEVTAHKSYYLTLIVNASEAGGVSGGRRM
ncbi:MAG: hypothetical protein NC413_01115 [Muribaculum sp.]|nr:hypothetical protein [Muribaculum sp.]